MDFLERLFGISPDGGDGTTELTYLVGLAAVVLALSWGRIVRNARGKTPSK